MYLSKVQREIQFVWFRCKGLRAVALVNRFVQGLMPFTVRRHGVPGRTGPSKAGCFCLLLGFGMRHDYPIPAALLFPQYLFVFRWVFQPGEVVVKNDSV